MNETFLLVMALGASTGIAIGCLAAVVVHRSRAEWSCTVRGHSVRVVATQNKKILFVDGERVMEKTTLSGCGATLTWDVPVEAGPPIVLSVTIAYPKHRAAPLGAIYADGQWIGGSPRGAPGVDVAATSTPPRTAITDARWPAAELLLRDLREVSRPEVTEATARIDAALTESFGKLAQLETARAAHKALGGSDAALDEAGARRQAHIVDLLDALRELHLLAVAGAAAPPLDRLDELVARVAAEAEVDRSISRAGAREAAARPVKS